MNDQNKQDTPENSSAKNLVHMKDKNTTVNSSDLNSRLQEIESELTHLNAREAATNKNFRELLSETKKHTSEQHIQLEETREQITEVKGNYKKLTQDYQRLAASANILSVTLEQARSELVTDIETLRRSTTERTDQLADGQLQMIERANRIEQKAAQMAEDIESRVNVISSTISALESRLVAEIMEMAAQSEQRDEALGIRASMIEENLNEETEARKLADSELSDRADQLETRTGELASQTEDLQLQANILDTRATDLEERNDELEETTQIHAARLSQVNDTVDRHHKGFAIAVVLIALTLAILSIMQQNRWLDTVDADSSMKETLATQATQVQENAAHIVTLETQNADAHKSFSSTDEKVTTAISKLEESISVLQDKADNNANRVSAMSPNRTFGQDNTIHNTEWLARQDTEHYVVQVMSAYSKKDLYTVAYRWSNLFNESNLSYIETEQAGKTVYTLVYGTFADKAHAEQISRRIPAVSYGNRPAARKLAELLK